MFKEFIKTDYFVNMLEFNDVYLPYIEKFEDQHEYLEQLICYIKEREADVGIFVIYRITDDILTTDLMNIIFSDEGYKTELWYDTFGPYGIPLRINTNDYLILRGDDPDNRHRDITAITFLQL